MVVASPHAMATRDVYRAHLSGLKKILGNDVVSFDILSRMNIFQKFTEWMEKEAGYVPREWATNILASEPVLGAALWHEVDVVYLISPMYFPMSIVELMRSKRVGLKVWAYFTECPYEDDTWARMQASKFDACFVNDRNSLAKFRAYNPNTHYLGHCYDPDRHYPGRGPTRGHQHVSFVGTGFPERRKFLEQVDWSGIDLRVYGLWEDIQSESPIFPYVKAKLINNEFTASIYRGSSVSVSLHRVERHWGFGDVLDEGEAYSVGPRTYELAACQTYQVSDFRQELIDIFGDSVPVYRSPKELGQLVRIAIDMTPAELRAVAKKQREAVLPHTAENRMRQLLEFAA